MSADERYALARRLWFDRSVRSGVHGPVKIALCEMAPGHERCMYCGDNQGTDVDHFEPMRRSPLRTFDWLNHLLACSLCNSHKKRDRFPVDAAGSPMLIDPTTDDPDEHLFLSLATGVYRARTDKGRHAIDVYDLNRDVLVDGRASARWVLASLFREWESARSREYWTRMDRIADTVRGQPFADGCQAMLRQAVLQAPL